MRLLPENFGVYSSKVDWGQEEKGTTEHEMLGWHHRLDGHGFGWTPGVGDGQGGLACWDCKESDMTEQLNWTDSSKTFFLPPSQTISSSQPQSWKQRRWSFMVEAELWTTLAELSKSRTLGCDNLVGYFIIIIIIYTGVFVKMHQGYSFIMCAHLWYMHTFVTHIFFCTADYTSIKDWKISLIKTEKVKIPILSMHCLLEKTLSLNFQFYVSDHTLFREIRIAKLNLINAHVAYQFLKKKKNWKDHVMVLSVLWLFWWN